MLKTITMRTNKLCANKNNLLYIVTGCYVSTIAEIQVEEASKQITSILGQFSRQDLLNMTNQLPLIKTQYKVIASNDTILDKSITEDLAKDNLTTSEIADMLREPDVRYLNTPIFEADQLATDEDAINNTNPNLQSENIQSSNAIVEKDDPKLHTYKAIESGNDYHSEGDTGKLTSEVCAIVIGVIFSLLLAGYLGIVLWKKAVILRAGYKNNISQHDEPFRELRLEL